MEDLRSRYNGLLAVMREGYTAEDGSELTFTTEEFTGRIIGLMCLFYEDGVVGLENFSDIAWDWKWDHYSKVLAELVQLGVLDEDGNLDPAECHQVKIEMESIQEGEYFV
ncbi:hypothetical protein JCM17380_24730 [Desulfosporosinus burensis]